MSDPQKVTIPEFREKKARAEKITMLTAYDVPLARLLDEAGIDAILVGDSLGMVALGYPTTVPVTMEEMIHHAKAVRRATSRALLIGDMPFMSFNISVKETVRNAGRFLKEAGCDAVKVEGGQGSLESLEAVRAILDAGIPVLGHLGLTPQTAGRLGGFKVQGKTAAVARRIIEAALELEAAGCFGIVLECVPVQVARVITQRLSLPTLGIGAGPYCDGQVLVTHDLLHLSGPFHPRFARVFARMDEATLKAVKEFREAVAQGTFPSGEESFRMSEEEFRRLQGSFKGRRASRQKIIRMPRSA